jgi:GalNAc-alpha-(1->4)-GalNAc-alpha-(1->3)-diNAcBac-PP-undecaprenol alpha-1,4-N-acetyl-D-galactosaminyltransferase
MHIGLIISSLNPPGGAERVLSELANFWIKKGYQVSLITFLPLSELPFYPLHSNINLISLNQSFQEASSLWRRFKNILSRILCLRKTLKTLQPNVIISFIDVTNIATLLASKGLGIPIIIAERTHPGHHRLSYLYKILRLYTYRWAKKIIVQTQSVAHYFPLKLQSHITIIPNAVKISPYQKIASDNLKPVKQICSVGRLCPYKGFDTLIQAFAAVLPLYPGLELIIYGEGEERLNLETMVLKLNLAGKVHFPGLTTNIYKALSQADLFVFPSRYEGFPNVLCEAMSVGLPVIASNCPGNIDIVRNQLDGILFAVGNVEELQTCLIKILKTSSQRQKLGQEALKITERFYEQHIFEMWDQLIRKAILS